ncbi:unnamed protein product, partial [Vitis vinifera]|uniref:Uncharacterized protein n=1 Tax=Vitis vinifera TaxID=29760 RepID=D7U208_VITVI
MAGMGVEEFLCSPSLVLVLLISICAKWRISFSSGTLVLQEIVALWYSGWKQITLSFVLGI